MKPVFFFLSFLFSFLLMSCNKEKISLAILSPADGAEFSIQEEIEVKVTATTKKGSITQVILFVDILDTLNLSQKPFNFIIPKQTFKEGKNYFLSVQAYSSEGAREGTSINIKIKS